MAFPARGHRSDGVICCTERYLWTGRTVVGFGLVMGVIGWACLTALLKRFG